MKVIKRINSKQTHHKENKFCISLILMMDLYVIMGGSLKLLWLSFDDVCQTIMLCTLDFYSAIC